MAPPENFFKYVDSDTAKIILKNCTLRWSAPSRFNDPFDVQFDLHIEYERGKIVEEALDEMWAVYTVGMISATLAGSYPGPMN
jgi:hypothetical protein